MHDDQNPAIAAFKRTPWNKGKLIGPRPPLRQKHVWAIRTRLHIEGELRDLAGKAQKQLTDKFASLDGPERGKLVC